MTFSDSEIRRALIKNEESCALVLAVHNAVALLTVHGFEAATLKIRRTGEVEVLDVTIVDAKQLTLDGALPAPSASEKR